MPIKQRFSSSESQDLALALQHKVSKLLAERTDLNERLRTNTQALRDAAGAGRLFGIDVQVPPELSRDSPQYITYPPRSVTTPVVQATLFDAAGDTSIREIVIEQLKAAGEKGIRAAAIRQVVEKALGRELHYKTVGMTLYRLSERGQARREGFVWFYVPESTKTKTPAS